MVQATKKRLGDILVDEGLLTDEQFKGAVGEMRRSRQPLVAVLIQMELVSEEDIVIALSDQLGIPHLRVGSYELSPDVLAEIPEAMAKQHHLIPVSKAGNTLTVAMSDPLNIVAIDDLRMVTSYDIETVISLDSEIMEVIERTYGGAKKGAPKKERKAKGELSAEADDFTDIIAMAEQQAMGDDVEVVEEGDDDGNMGEDKAEAELAPVIRLVNALLINAIRMGASDIHLEPFEKEFRVRYRIDGVLREQQSPPKSLQNALTSRIKVISELDIAERRRPQDGRFRIRFDGREIDFRVSTLPTYYGEKTVLRILDKGSLALDLAKLGFEKQPYEAIMEGLSRPNGIILVTGPTGSGKTTTLYSALHKLNDPEVNLVTVEDPVEYELAGVNQVQVRPAAGLTFAAGLRSILRQDPDIVMVGEIRDEETADIAIKAALTGHLVLSTLHTNDAPGAITRLLDMGMEPFLVSSSLLVAAAQRLARRVCISCKRPAEIPKDVLERAQFTPDAGTEFRPMMGKGCPKCSDTGYKGRIALLEAMLMTEATQDLVMRAASAGDIKRQAVADGMLTLRQAGLARMGRGETTLEEVLRVTAPD